MVAATIRRDKAFSGLRPLSVTRDLAGVAQVVAESFRDEMDAMGRRAVRDMRLMGRLGLLAWWFELLAPTGQGFAPGFVWVEDGRIVGNATVRRTSPYGRGYAVGNVAVLPEYRGRGIARQLMEACLDKAREEDGAWAALEVRADNTPALHLYLSLGFRHTGAVARLRREASLPMPAPADMPAGIRIRKPRPTEGRAILALAQSVTPEGLRWAEPLRESEFDLGWDRRFDLWLSGRGEAWWVIEAESRIVAAIQAETFHEPQAEGHLRMWVASGNHSHTALILAALQQRRLTSRPVVITHPAADTDALRVLADLGFRPLQTLTHMKLDLR